MDMSKMVKCCKRKGFFCDKPDEITIIDQDRQRRNIWGEIFYEVRRVKVCRQARKDCLHQCEQSRLL